MHDRHLHHFKTLNNIHIPSVMRVTAWIIFLGLIFLFVFLFYTPWVQNTHGQGRVTALDPADRQQEISAFVSGRIQEWYVRDGMHVNVGDPIVKIVDNDPKLIERLQAERAQIMAKLDAAEAAEKTAKIDAERTKELYKEGLSARREFEQAKIKLDERRAVVAAIAAEITRAEVNLSRQSFQVVRAPRNGVILQINAGDAATFISTGDVLATFVPDNVERIVEIFIDGRDVVLVRPGDKVRLQFEGWPAVQFSGWPSVAVGTFGGIVQVVDPAAQASGRFRVLIKEDKTDLNPWPDENFVRYGSKVRGWILMETVKLGYELWRQYNNFPPEYRAAGDL